MAALGVGVVAAVHFGRLWAEGGYRDLASAVGRDALLGVGLAASLLLVLSVLRVRQPGITIALAVALQAAVMFTVEHLDGFWMPFWFDVSLGFATWAAAGAVAGVVTAG